MKYKAPGQCPVCSEKLDITKLNCPKCHTAIEGVFQPCEFCRLPKDELNFLKVFIKCRGNIKDMEKELGLSYPTVRSKLDSLIQMLGFKVETKETRQMQEEIEKEKQKIIELLEKGELTAKEATEKIKELSI